MATRFETIDGYVAAAAPDARPILESIRAAIRDEAPDAVEAISYQMPTFRWKGTPLIHFAAWQSHIGMYPVPTGTDAFQRDVAPYATAKGTLRFPLAQPIPLRIVRAVVRARIAEIENG